MITPIEGVIISGGPFLKIKLISGKTLTVPRVKKLAFGDKAWICFNYTDMSVKDILTDYEYHELDKGEEFELTPDFDPETGILEGKVLGNSVFLSD
jgi:hypothetical protein